MMPKVMMAILAPEEIMRNQSMKYVRYLKKSSRVMPMSLAIWRSKGGEMSLH
jgi:hypothetical protein